LLAGRRQHLEPRPALPERSIFSGETAAEIGGGGPRNAKAAGRG
jgi:hypothetical protein